jgi:hypothetical protein
MLVISGHEKALFKNFLADCNPVATDPSQIQPGTQGSLGVWWGAHFDISAEVPPDTKPQDTLKVLQSKDIFNVSGARLSKKEALQLLKFYEFAQDKGEPLFFIKEGCKVRWLAKKIGNYYFEPKYNAQGLMDSRHLPHRISFEIIRTATAKEEGPWLGRACSTIMELTEGVDIPLVDPTASPQPAYGLIAKEKQMPPKRKAAAAPVALTPDIKTTASAASTGSESVASSESGSVKATAPKKRATPAALKKAAAPIITPEAPPQQITPEYVELPKEPREICEVLFVPLKKFTDDYGNTYFKSSKDKLFKIGPKDKPGPYIGRWDATKHRIVKGIADSDSESYDE